MRTLTRRRLGTVGVTVATILLGAQTPVLKWLAGLGPLGTELAKHTTVYSLLFGGLIAGSALWSAFSGSHVKQLRVLLEHVHGACWGTPNQSRNEDYRLSFWAPSRRPSKWRARTVFGELWRALWGPTTLRCVTRSSYGASDRRWPIATNGDGANGLVAHIFEYGGAGGANALSAIGKDFPAKDSGDPKLAQYLRDSRIGHSDAQSMGWAGCAVYALAISREVGVTIGVLVVECKIPGKVFLDESNRFVDDMDIGPSLDLGKYLVAQSVTCAMIYDGATS